MRELNYKYMCPRCKNSYSSSVPLRFCVCGSLLSQAYPDDVAALRDLFTKNNPFSVDMFKR